MIPIRDENPTRTFPALTLAVIAVNVLVFAYQLSLPPRLAQELTLRRGLVPGFITGLPELGPPALVPGAASFLTSMFMHGDAVHLLGNMWFLWIFGNNVEDALGHVRFAFFYVGSGLAAALAQIAATPSSMVPMIGASGAIAGVLGAYLILFPRARILTLVPFIFVYLIRLPAFIVLGIWFLFQVLHSMMAASTLRGGVAWFAHIGGFTAGMILVLVLVPRRPHPSRPAAAPPWV